MRRDIIILVLVMLLGFPAIFGLSAYLEHHRISVPESYEDADLAFQGKKLKGYALGAEGMLSDWYWMRALQYIGGKIVKRSLDNLNLDDLTELNPRLLYPMLDISTELDPKSMAPFSYGATILPSVSSEQAIRLTKKGIEHNPDNWRLYQYLGYIHWRLKDYPSAAEVYDKGASIPGAPPFFRMMAARIRTESGSRDIAREIYKQAIAEAPDESTKAVSRNWLLALDSLDERDILDPVLEQYKKQTGRCPTQWSDIMSRLSNAQIPNGRGLRVNEANNVVDPAGVPYRIDNASCKAVLDWQKSPVPNFSGPK